MIKKKENDIPLPQSILIVTHYFATGPAIELKDYLLPKVNTLLFVSHPFSFSPGDRKSLFKEYKKGKIVSQKSFYYIPNIEVLVFIKDFIATFYFILTYKNKISLCIASNNLNAFVALFLRKLGRIDKVVYYNIDYTQKRFSNPILNAIYHFIDRNCCYYSDLNWVGIKRTIHEREKNGVETKKVAKIITVPDGNHSLSIKRKDVLDINMHTLISVGHIIKRQGLDLVLESLPDLKEKIKDIKVIIIGTGDYLQELKKKAKKLKIESSVQFRGYIEDHKKIENILTKCAIGLAPYVPDKDSHTYYSEAGKPKLYLGCGIPVVITNVPSIAYEIEKNKAGKMIHYNKTEFVNAVLDVIKNDKVYSEYKKNATRFGLQFDWSVIFKNALSETMKFI